MKKNIFYSLVRENGKPVAKQWQGWTDGEYNYYKSCDMWYCIHPECGLSVAYGETRAIARANADLCTERIEQKRNSREWSSLVDGLKAAIAEVDQCLSYA